MAIVITFTDISVGDPVGDQLTDYGITFTPPMGNVAFDPQSPFSNVVSAAREPGSPVEFPTWSVKGTLSSPDHSRFGISVNEGVTITFKDLDNRLISNYAIRSPKFSTNGSFFYGEFATGKGNIASFDIQKNSDRPFQIASIMFDTVGVPHRPDFRLMLSDASIPSRNGQTGFISVTVARLYLSTGPVNLAVSSDPPGLFLPSTMMFDGDDGEEAQLPLTAIGIIQTDNVIIVTGTPSSPTTGIVNREMRYSYPGMLQPLAVTTVEGIKIVTYMASERPLKIVGKGTVHLVEASFKTESRTAASDKYDSFISYLEGKRWFLNKGSLKTQPSMERY